MIFLNHFARVPLYVHASLDDVIQPVVELEPRMEVPVFEPAPFHS